MEDWEELESGLWVPREPEPEDHLDDRQFPSPVGTTTGTYVGPDNTHYKGGLIVAS